MFKTGGNHRNGPDVPKLSPASLTGMVVPDLEEGVRFNRVLPGMPEWILSLGLITGATKAMDARRGARS